MLPQLHTKSKFYDFFVSTISYRPTDLSLLKEFSKNVSISNSYNLPSQSAVQKISMSTSYSSKISGKCTRTRLVFCIDLSDLAFLFITSISFEGVQTIFFRIIWIISGFRENNSVFADPTFIKSNTIAEKLRFHIWIICFILEWICWTQRNFRIRLDEFSLLWLP